jgi:hypothetical protein
MTERLERFMKRYKDASERGQTWRNHFEDIYDYFMPNKNIAKQSAPGEKHNIHLYDSTGIMAVRSFVSALHTGLTPPGLQWFDLSPGSDISESDPNYQQIKEQLRLTTDLIFRHIAASNFDLAINETYYDLAVGTGALVVNEGPADNPLLFSSFPLLRIYPEAGVRGDVETVWRDWRKFYVRNIRRTWPQAKLNSELETMLESDPDAAVDLVEGTVFNQAKNNWDFVLWENRTRSMLADIPIESSPWIVFRGFKRADEVYGRGPADQALPTMQSLNQMAKDELKAATLRSNPIFMGTSDGVFNPHTIMLEPWSIIPINPTSMGQLPLAAVPMGGDPKFGELKMADLRDMINKIFFAEPLGPLDPSSNLTATEILLRNQEALEQKVPFIGRLQFELLDKIIDRVVFILRKKGLIPDIKVDGKEVTVKYKSPLIQTQGLQNVNRAVQLAQTAQSIFGPQLSVLGLNSDEWFEYLADNLDVDPKLIKSAAELQQLGEQATQVAMQQPQLPGAPTGGLPTPQSPAPTTQQPIQPEGGQ